MPTTTFLSAGTSETNDFSLYYIATTSNGTVTSSGNITHDQQPRAIKYTVNSGGKSRAANRTWDSVGGNDAGRRYSFYMFLDNYASGYTSGGGGVDSDLIFGISMFSDGTLAWGVSLDNLGLLHICDKNTTSQAVGTTVVSLNTWHQICICYKITGVSVNEFRVYLDGNLEVSASNITVQTGGLQVFPTGMGSWDATNTTCNMYCSDQYADNGNDLSYPGDIRVTAKRPYANGTSNDFASRIGSGGSNYGGGNSSQVNERPLNGSNGWAGVVSGIALTEEYNIEPINVGDFDLSQGNISIIDYMAWICINATNSETAQFIVGGATSNIGVVSGTSFFKKFKGSTSYPPGTGSDIGVTTTTAANTVNLFELGVLVAYKPITNPFRGFIGV